MTTEITIPIRCSTVKKVKDSIPTLIFWVVVAASVLLFSFIIRAAILQKTGIWETILGVIIFSAVSLLFLWMTCPYKFKCIQE